MTPQSLPAGVHREQLPGGRWVTYLDVAGLSATETERLFNEVRAAYGLPVRGRPHYLPFAAAVSVVVVGVFLCLIN